MYETRDNVILMAQVPGMSEDQIRIEAHDDTLTITGERSVELPEGYAVHRSERQPYRFARSFGLPCRVDLEHTTAQVKDGLLSTGEAKRMHEFFINGLLGTTYLLPDDNTRPKAGGKKTRKSS